jgi:hypothetical protein
LAHIVKAALVTASTSWLSSLPHACDQVCFYQRAFDSALYEKERIALSFRKISMAISRTVVAGRHNIWSCFDIKENLSSHFWTMINGFDDRIVC